MAGVLYLSYIFLAHWSLGLLTHYWFLKTLLLLINCILITLHKIVMIETSQSTITRDLACVNLVYLSYVLTYPWVGYPWYSFALYVVVLAHHVVGTHYVD